jgi:hypothetical protein
MAHDCSCATPAPRTFTLWMLIGHRKSPHTLSPRVVSAVGPPFLNWPETDHSCLPLAFHGLFVFAPRWASAGILREVIRAKGPANEGQTPWLHSAARTSARAPRRAQLRHSNNTHDLINTNFNSRPRREVPTGRGDWSLGIFSDLAQVFPPPCFLSQSEQKQQNPLRMVRWLGFITQRIDCQLC